MSAEETLLTKYFPLAIISPFYSCIATNLFRVLNYNLHMRCVFNAKLLGGGKTHVIVESSKQNYTKEVIDGVQKV